MHKKIQAVLLSEGHSNRFWPFNTDHKSTYSIAGSPIIIHTLRALSQTRLIKDVCVIHKPSSAIPSMLPKKIDDMKITCIVGDDYPKGTGASLYKAKDYVNGNFALIWPDMVNADIFIKSLVKVSSSNNVSSAMIGAETSTPWNFGMLKIDGNIIKEVVEKPKKWEYKESLKRVGVELFTEDIFDIYSSLENKHEIDLIDAINVYVKKHKMILVKQEHYVPVLKYPWDLLTIMNIIIHYFDANQDNSHLNSQNINFNKKSIIKEDVSIGKDFLCKGNIYIGKKSVIGNGVKIFGHSIIEDNVVIEDNCKIVCSVIGSNSHISKNTILEDSIISEENKIGSDCIVRGAVGDKSAVQVVNENRKVISTGRLNLGLIMGEGSTIGNNCNINPGVILLPGTKIKNGSRVSFDYLIL